MHGGSIGHSRHSSFITSHCYTDPSASGKQLRSMYSDDLLSSRIFSTEVGVRPAEPCSVSVVATHQLLTVSFPLYIHTHIYILRHFRDWIINVNQYTFSIPTAFVHPSRTSSSTSASPSSAIHTSVISAERSSRSATCRSSRGATKKTWRHSKRLSVLIVRDTRSTRREAARRKSFDRRAIYGRNTFWKMPRWACSFDGMDDLSGDIVLFSFVHVLISSDTSFCNNIIHFRPTSWASFTSLEQSPLATHSLQESLQRRVWRPIGHSTLVSFIAQGKLASFNMFFSSFLTKWVCNSTTLIDLPFSLTSTLQPASWIPFCTSGCHRSTFWFFVSSRGVTCVIEWSAGLSSSVIVQ